MDIQLNLMSEDYISLPIPHQYKECINNLNNNKEQDVSINKETEKIIKEELKNNNLFLPNITNEEFFDVKITKNNNNVGNNMTDNHSKQNYDYLIEIKSKDKFREEIENKIKICMEKENILLNKQNEFKKICENIKIDQKLLEKKLTNLSQINKDEIEPTINQLVSQVLDFENFKKDAEKTQELMINYRESLILGNCFKIYIRRINKPTLYIISKKIIFLNNDKLFQSLNKINVKLIKQIIDDIFDSIIKKISNNDIFKNHKEEYEKHFNFYKEVCYLFPILIYFDSSQEKNIYELDKDLNLNFSEYTYDQLSRLDSTIPKRKGLNITLSYFKEHALIENVYSTCLKRHLSIDTKYKTTFPIYKKSSFLYD